MKCVVGIYITHCRVSNVIIYIELITGMFIWELSCCGECLRENISSLRSVTAVLWLASKQCNLISIGVGEFHEQLSNYCPIEKGLCSLENSGISGRGYLRAHWKGCYWRWECVLLETIKKKVFLDTGSLISESMYMPKPSLTRNVWYWVSLIQGIHKIVVQFQKLTRNLFLTLHGHNLRLQQRQLSKFLMRYQQFASHAYCWASFQDGVAVGKDFLCAPFWGVQMRRVRLF
jgi:hypothetical protein